MARTTDAVPARGGSRRRGDADLPGGILPVAGQVACAALAIAATLWLMHVLFPRTSSAAYAVLAALFALVARWMGRKAGYWAVGATGTAVAYFLLDGEGFAVTSPADALGLVLLVSAGIYIVSLVGGLDARGKAAEGRCEALERRDARRSAMIAELSHRIGNDLGALVSVSELQAAKAEHDESRVILAGIADRIYVLGKVYGRLCSASGGESSIDMRAFLEGLCGDIGLAHLALRPVSLETALEPATMPASQAILAGIVLNEAVVNALKHAFPDDRPGRIIVEFETDPDDVGLMRLTVRDDGVGPDLATGPGTLAGQRLMRGMAYQIRGSYVLTRDGAWTMARLRFPKPVTDPHDRAAPPLVYPAAP